MKNKIKQLCIGIFLLALSACGGGSSTDANDTSGAQRAPAKATVNTAPVAAVPDRTVLVGDTVTMDGSASSDANGNALLYRWAIGLLPSQSRAVLVNANTVRPTFLADTPGVYKITLTVSDGKLDSQQITATVVAYAKPVIRNNVPVANAGPDQSAVVGTRVVLNGGASADAEGSALQYRWTLVSKPASSATDVWANASKQPSLLLDVAGTYFVTLTVNDGHSDSLPSTIKITATVPPSSANIAPTANAGIDLTVALGSIVKLDGGQSNDPNNDVLAYNWTIAAKPSGSAAQLIFSNTKTPHFTADRAGIYDVNLSVNDGKMASAAVDTISVVVLPPTAIVIADTGIYRCASISKELAMSLYVQGHTYLDRDHDGRPCEANDISNEQSNPWVAPPTTGGGLCYVNGYRRKNGTYVSGYYRRCPT